MPLPPPAVFGLLFAASVAVAAAEAQTLLVDPAGTAAIFDGIGGLSGGGATSRLLVDYLEPQRSEILDLLFKPAFGASLQILKVEIGGDSQSTDGTESSHMHDNTTVDLDTGYEWWLMQEAKKRNPDIKIVGLPWAYPGWVGNDPVTGEPSGSPFTFPDQTSRYVTEWIKGARDKYGVVVDYLGIWNERSSDSKYAQALRATLDNAGFNATQIIAKDGGADICDAMAADPAYAASVDVVGLHYPSDFENYSVCHALGKPIWASEESSSYDDGNGAACWARVIQSHWALNQMTASIMWNLVGAYYHGTNWYASSMLTSVQPWSGHYEINPTVWATAHVTQFSRVGWRYLKDGSGSGKLPQGGYYSSMVSPDADENRDFSIFIVKVSHEHAPCTRPGLPGFDVSAENVTFQIADSLLLAHRAGSAGRGLALAVRYSNFRTDEAGTGSEVLFEKLPDVQVDANGKFTLSVPLGGVFTLSTLRSATKVGSSGEIPPSAPSFPLPHFDDFEGKPNGQEAPYFADQIGAFEVHPASFGGNSSNHVMRQMVPQLPIGWSDSGTLGPMTLIGMREWQDITVSASFATPTGIGCVATRVDQMWRNGIVLCVDPAARAWNLTLGGPKLGTGEVAQCFANGTYASPSPQTWTHIELTTVGGSAAGKINGVAAFAGVEIRDIDSGFAAMGSMGWYPIEFDSFAVSAAGGDWQPQEAPAAKAGDAVAVSDCPRNGVDDSAKWALDSNWQLRHVGSGLCATASANVALLVNGGAGLTLEPCATNTAGSRQQFENDYTNIRNRLVAINYLQQDGLVLAGNLDGSVSLVKSSKAISSEARAVAAMAEEETMADVSTQWLQWVFFPNRGQLRNQYVADPKLGYPKCLVVV